MMKINKNKLKYFLVVRYKVSLQKEKRELKKRNYGRYEFNE